MRAALDLHFRPQQLAKANDRLLSHALQLLRKLFPKAIPGAPHSSPPSALSPAMAYRGGYVAGERVQYSSESSGGWLDAHVEREHRDGSATLLVQAGEARRRRLLRRLLRGHGLPD